MQYLRTVISHPESMIKKCKGTLKFPTGKAYTSDTPFHNETATLSREYALTKFEPAAAVRQDESFVQNYDIYASLKSSYIVRISPKRKI